MTLSCDESNMSRAAEGIDMDCKSYKRPPLSIETNRCDRLVQGEHHLSMYCFVLNFIANMVVSS